MGITYSSNFNIMKTLTSLDNVEKAKLLHELFKENMPDFISYLYEYTESVLDSKEELITSWDNGMFGVDFWFSLTETIKAKAERYKRDLERSSSVFSNQLFDGYNAIFTAHVLVQYASRACQEPKFKQAIELLFT